MIEDLRHALRILIKDPRSSVLIILILGLGIGANAAVFSLLDAVVLNPFPYVHPDRIVEVVRGTRQRFSGPFNYRAYTALRDHNEVFEQIAAYRAASLTIALGETPEPFSGTEVSVGVFELLGFEPLLGRGFTPEEQGDGGAGVAIISHHFWETRYAADPDVLGRTIRIDGTDRAIVGVMPPGFTFYQAASVWIPLPVDASSPDGDPYRFGVIARLRNDITLTQAHVAMATLRETIAPLFDDPATEYERMRFAQPLRIATLAEGWNPAGFQYLCGLIQFASAFVLLIVCANLASLFLARGVGRQRELAVRRALGAPRHRLVRLLFTENALFAAAGGLLGLLFAVWGRELLPVVLSSRMLVGIQMHLSLRIVAFVGGMSVFTSIAFGMIPALELSKADLGNSLREWGAGATRPGRARSRERALAILQIAMSLTMLIGATVAGRSLTALQNVDPGFDAKRVYQVLLSFGERYPDESREAVTHRIIMGLDAIPTLEAVGWRAYAGEDVIGGIRDRLGGFVETADGPSDLSARRGGSAVNDGYFKTFGLALVSGRTFDERERPGVPSTAVLSERSARILWPGEDAIGRAIRFPGADRWLTVIGVVSDRIRIATSSYDRTESGMRAEVWPDVYLSASQHNANISNLLWVRPRLDATAWAEAVRATVAEVDPGLQVAALRTVWEGEYEPHQFVHRIFVQVLGVLGAVAVLLSALGTYSVISYSWTQRTREVGLRVALGATASDVFSLVLGQTQKLALVGVLVGTAMSIMLYRLASGWFFGVGSWDPIAYGGVALLLLAVAAVAGLGPARRATQIDAAEALRKE